MCFSLKSLPACGSISILTLLYSCLENFRSSSREASSVTHFCRLTVRDHRSSVLEIASSGSVSLERAVNFIIASCKQIILRPWLCHCCGFQNCRAVSDHRSTLKKLKMCNVLNIFSRLNSFFFTLKQFIQHTIDFSVCRLLMQH